MQYSAGTVTVTIGIPKVIADINADWTDAQTALSYGQPVQFSLLGAAESLFSVVIVSAPPTTVSGFWELTLSTNWPFATQVGATYMVHAQFTTNYGLALPGGGGERQWAQLLARNMNIIDVNMSGAGSGMAAGLTTVVGSGKTLVASNLLVIPDGATLNIQAGGAVVIT